MQQCVITTIAAQSDREMLQKVSASAGNHVDKCWVTCGTHRVTDCDIIPQTEQLSCNLHVFHLLCIR